MHRELSLRESLIQGTINRKKKFHHWKFLLKFIYKFNWQLSLFYIPKIEILLNVYLQKGDTHKINKTNVHMFEITLPWSYKNVQILLKLSQKTRFMIVNFKITFNIEVLIKINLF